MMRDEERVRKALGLTDHESWPTRELFMIGVTLMLGGWCLSAGWARVAILVSLGLWFVAFAFTYAVEWAASR